MQKILCFGELLLRISPAATDATQDPFSMYMGGAEANVARALASWGININYCSALPDNFMAARLIQFLNREGVGTDKMILGGDRIGVYYLDQGADLKGAVIYDRADSAFAKLEPGKIDWDKVFEGIGWFNFSAITPAINQNLADICLDAVKAATRKNIVISVDLNYRARLWKYGKDPVSIMKKIVPYCNLVMGNIWSANTLLGIGIDEDIHAKQSKQTYIDQAIAVSKEIISLYPACRTVANTFRFDTAEKQILYYTSLYHDRKNYLSPQFKIDQIVDRSGSGDCFMAGLIYGLLKNHDPQGLLNFATAAAIGKLKENGDGTRQTVASVKNLLMKYTSHL